MERTLIKKIFEKEGDKALIEGRIFNTRNLGNIVFLVVGDYTGTIQAVMQKGIDVKVDDVVAIEGMVKKDERAKGGFELKVEKIDIISSNIEELPFDITKNDVNMNLNTLLDYRTLSLRHPRIQAIFRLYDILLKGYETAMREEGFIEIKTPKILGSATEGGANFFKIKYFDKEATLAQSPQFYKQIMVGVFERVFEVGSVFRAEPHFTTRHVNEYTGLDAEFGPINGVDEVMDMLNRIMAKMFKMLTDEGQEYLEPYVNIPVPEKNIKGVALDLMSYFPKDGMIPRIKLSELKKILKDKYGHEIPEDTDIDTTGEELAGKYALEEFGSDFLFITHYPWSQRPFYTMPDPENPKETYGFDLLFKGLEIASGGQRIHKYDELVANMKKKKVKPDGMEFYLDTFKYAMPPHGGWGLGSERIIKQILNLDSIKEAILFPRDVKRLIP